MFCLGIWADDDSDNEATQSSSRRKKNMGGGGRSGGSGSKKNMDYTAPVSFVAGGIQQSGKKKDPVEEKLSEDGKFVAKIYPIYSNSFNICF